MYLTEAYGAGADDGYYEGVNLDDHQADDTSTGQARYAGCDPTDVHVAAGLILGSLVALWLLGGVVFRRANQ